MGYHALPTRIQPAWIPFLKYIRLRYVSRSHLAVRELNYVNGSIGGFSGILRDSWRLLKTRKNRQELAEKGC